jgi:hypothetical protein
MKTGQCLCGAVTLRTRLREPTVLACHCQQCQRWTGGGPLFTVRVEDLEIDGIENIATYRASDWGERAFCRVCGSTLYWKMQAGAVSGIAVGLLDDQSDLSVAMEIFTDHRPGWLPEWGSAGQKSEAEMHAQLEAHLKRESQP